MNRGHFNKVGKTAGKEVLGRAEKEHNPDLWGWAKPEL